MTYDVWFAKKGDALYAVAADPGESPELAPRRVGSVKETLQAFKYNGHKIAHVGICDYDMIRKFT